MFFPAGLMAEMDSIIVNARFHIMSNIPNKKKDWNRPQPLFFIFI